jgi:hypothetical protein
MAINLVTEQQQAKKACFCPAHLSACSLACDACLLPCHASLLVTSACDLARIPFEQPDLYLPICFFFCLFAHAFLACLLSGLPISYLLNFPSAKNIQNEGHCCPASHAHNGL